MMMIPVLHILGQGGILYGTEPLSLHYHAAWILEIASYSAVNIYGIISGYVGYSQPHPFSRLLLLYFQVIFYTLLTNLVFHFCYPEMVNSGTVLAAVFPFAYDVYWYFSAYFCLYFFMPYLDEFMRKQKQSDSRKLILLILLVFSVLQTIFNADFGYTNKGYSFLWLAILYLIGAYLKKYGTGSHDNRWKYFAGYILCVLFIWLAKVAAEQAGMAIHHEYIASDRLINYTSLPFVLCAVFLILFFKELEFRPWMNKVISFFSPVSFDVYLFHEEPLVVAAYISGAFVGYMSLKPLVMICAVAGTALVIWLIGSAAGRVRYLVFRLLRMEKLSVFLAGKAEDLLRKPYRYFRPDPVSSDRGISEE